jgi:GDSL-like Lipase/Acylhydrolase family
MKETRHDFRIGKKKGRIDFLQVDVGKSLIARRPPIRQSHLMCPAPALRRRLFLLAAFHCVLSLAQAKPADWEASITRLTAGDAAHPPPSHGIVFIGSSSIFFWETLEQDFPGLPVIRRGFGGSELADSVFYFDRLVLPYRPDKIVLYAGENDIFAGKTPEQVASDFLDFCGKAHAALPSAQIFYIAMKPSPSRWHLHDKFERGNAMIAALCASDPQLTFVDVYSAMLGADGQPRAELFRDDKLHMKHEGYVIWIKLLTPLLKTDNLSAHPQAK